MRYYNAALYDKTDNLTKDNIITVENGIITDIRRGILNDVTDEDINCGNLPTYPAFMDCCTTLPGRSCFRLYGLDISSMFSLGEYANALENTDASHGIRAYGFNTFVVGGEYGMLKKILDNRCPDRPGYIYADDMTNVIVNDYILEDLKKYISVDQNMYKTGLLDVNQIYRVRKHTDVLDFTENELYDSLLDFQRELLHNGIAAIRAIDCFGGKNLIGALSRAIKDGTWKLVTVIAVPVYPFDTEAEMYQRYMEYSKVTSDHVHVLGVSITLDGSIDSGQAALLTPYAVDSKWRGDITWNLDKLNDTVTKFADMGVDINFNAYGDRAVSLAVTCGAAVSGKCDVTITHAYLAEDIDIKQARDANITFCVELNTVPYDGMFYEGDKTMLGERIYAEYPVGRIMYAGVNVISGNNAPMLHTLSPVTGVYRAAHRTSDDDATPSHLLRTYGRNAYKWFGLYDQMGNIEVGKQANFVLLDKDIVNMREDLLCDCNIVRTVIRGEWS